jgi:hypothetical protein
LITATGNPAPLKAATATKCQFAVASITISAGSIASSSLTNVANPAGELAKKAIWLRDNKGLW